MPSGIDRAKRVAIAREVRIAAHLKVGTDIPFQVMSRGMKIEPERRTDPEERDQGRYGLESPSEETSLTGRSSTSSYGGPCRESSVPEVRARDRGRYTTCSRSRLVRGPQSGIGPEKREPVDM